MKRVCCQDSSRKYFLLQQIENENSSLIEDSINSLSLSLPFNEGTASNKDILVNNTPYKYDIICSILKENGSLKCKITHIKSLNNTYSTTISNKHAINSFKIDGSNILFNVTLDTITFNCYDNDTKVVTSGNPPAKVDFQIPAGDYDFSCSLNIFNINDNVKTYLVYNNGNNTSSTASYTDASKFGLYYLTFQSDNPVWTTKNFENFTKCDIANIKVALNDIILDKKDGDNYSVIGLNSENPYYKIPIKSDLMFEALEKKSIGAVSIQKNCTSFSQFFFLPFFPHFIIF